MSIDALVVSGLLTFSSVIAVLTVIGTPVVKLSVKPLTWAQALRASAFGTSVGFGVYGIFVLGAGFRVIAEGKDFDRTFAVDLAPLVLIAAAWLISYDLRRQGYPQKFPGAGARVGFAWIAASWILFFVAEIARH